jgi:hypothetical protein
MNENFPIEGSKFFTTTIYKWNHLLRNDKHKDIIIIELISEDLFKQKLEYIHYNPVKAGLCEVPKDYYYSSARLYQDGTNNFGMLKHYSGN